MLTQAMSLMIVSAVGSMGAIVATTCDTGDSWMQFRGPDGAGVSQSTDPFPAKLDLQANVRWKVPVPSGHSAPIVVGESIVLTGYEPGKLSTMCFDRVTGQLRWRRNLTVAAFEKTHRQHGPATPTPASDGQRIFVVFGSLGVISYDLAGNELWRHERETRRNLFGTASSPVVIDDHLIVFLGDQQESLLQVLNPANGSVVWQRRREGPASSWSTPVRWKSGNQVELLIYEPFHLRCLSLKDGNERWAIPGLADEPITTPQFASGLIFTTSYNLRTNPEAIGLPAFEDLLDECDANGDGAINLDESKSNQSVLSRPDADGQGDHPLRIFFRMLDVNKNGQIQASEWPRLQAWIDGFEHANGIIALRPGTTESAPELAWQYKVGVPECPTPIVWKERLYAVRNGGVVTCLEAGSGKLVFQDRLAPGGPYYASPVAGDNKIYLASARGSLTIMNASKQPQVIATCDLGEPISATPALAGGALIVRSQNHLWLFENSAGDQ